MEDLTHEYSLDLGIELTSLDLIQENKYCYIYRSEADRQPFIIKKYKGDDSSLVREEARALDFYHDIAKDDPDLIDSRAVKLNAEKNLLCIGFVEGECFSDILYRGRKDVGVREQSVRIMGVLGRLIKGLYEITHVPGAETSPFIFEYCQYSSRQLESIPGLGFLLFKGIRKSTSELSEAFKMAQITPSFIHGDFVFRNIHVEGERVGLIDFANTIQRSHTLNDVYNLRFALNNMILPKGFKKDLWSAFRAGIQPLSFPEITHHFYYEYHRRRWLMLKIRSRNPVDQMQAVRGLFSFAKSYEQGGMAL
jgi:tRNA A-37 threonylcarbamoyl transferase component Bud32